MVNKIDSLGTSYSLNKVSEKKPIVFIHGVGLSKEIWEPQLSFFKKYNTLAYDLIGHGKTPLKKSKVKIDDFLLVFGYVVVYLPPTKFALLFNHKLINDFNKMWRKIVETRGANP